MVKSTIDTVKKGDKVKVEYTGTLSDGTVFDTSDNRPHLNFEAGAEQVIPGFDKTIIGMKKNEEKTVTIPAEEAYGPIRTELIRDFSRDKLPEKPEPKVGMILLVQTPTGQQIPAKITKISKDKVTIDLNHPLAGKELTFKIKVVGINEPEKESSCGCCSSCSGCN